MTAPRETLLARLLRLDARHRAKWRAQELGDHMRRDIGLGPQEPAPRNPFTQGW